MCMIVFINLYEKSTYTDALNERVQKKRNSRSQSTKDVEEEEPVSIFFRLFHCSQRGESQYRPDRIRD